MQNIYSKKSVYYIVMKKFLFLFFFLPFSLKAQGVFDLNRWYSILNDVQTRAIEMKISAETINSVVQGAVFIPSIVKSDKNQSEFKLTLDKYLSNVVNDTRIKEGKLKKKEYPKLLSRVDNNFGVPSNVILAFWGIESNYGRYKSKYRLSDAFLTLIYDGRRSSFFTNQLFALMKAADKDKVDISDIFGSWAGAMGHFQFIPTTLELYGMDGNKDGKIDIIHSVSDAMFSAGNYLSKLGWNKYEKIVREVILPDNFDLNLADGKIKKTVNEWKDLGILTLNGNPLPSSEIISGLIYDTSDIGHTRAFLTYPNFYRIKRWNNSNWYAIAIAMLSEKLK